ncbi:hypothetical protein B296_00028136 [Ensete ventricosum]|uniref:Uncharacterized protein n=1 Tax=Ensete ventricosum TaxID=4639 RepID=A0A427AF26_ENSVE|nr:hypothetical protein B296_00028136 [Ensete ventricosum]
MLYQCTDIQYADAYRCFDEEEKEGEVEGVMEEHRRKKEKGRRKKKKEEEEKKCSDSIPRKQRQHHSSEKVVPLQHRSGEEAMARAAALYILPIPYRF